MVCVIISAQPKMVMKAMSVASRPTAIRTRPSGGASRVGSIPDARRAGEQQVREKLGGRINGDLSSVAQVKAQIATARGQVLVPSWPARSLPLPRLSRALSPTRESF